MYIKHVHLFLIWFSAAYDLLCGTDNHTLHAVVKMSESYDNLAKALCPLLDEIESPYGYRSARSCGGKLMNWNFS